MLILHLDIVLRNSIYIVLKDGHPTPAVEKTKEVIRFALFFFGGRYTHAGGSGHIEGKRVFIPVLVMDDS